MEFKLKQKAKIAVTGSKIDHVDEEKNQAKDFSIHNDVAIAGFVDGVARRPYWHLMASILWIFQFEYTNINRCPEFFVGDRNFEEA